MITIEIYKVFEAALEHTFYLAPNDLGLTTEELLEVGRRQGLRDGELKDALGLLEHHARFANGRFQPKADIGTPLGMFFVPMNP